MSWIELEDKSLVTVKVGPEAVAVEGARPVDKRLAAILSTENEDSDGDIIHAGKTKNGAGWLLARFNKTPVITWQHDIYRPNLSAPTTRAVVAKDEKLGRVLMVDPVEFDMEDPEAARLDGKLRRRVLTEWSAGFKVTPGKYEPRRNAEGDRSRGFEVFEAELIEAAVCNRGANLDTETRLKSLLGRREIAQKVETAGDAEANDLKAEIEALDHQLKQLQKMLAELHEGVAPLRALDLAKLEKAAGYAERQEVLEREKARAVDGMLAALQRAGTAHP